MHLGGNRRQVPLTNEALSIIIYVKMSRYAMLRRIKRCKRVLYLVLHRTKKTRIGRQNSYYQVLDNITLNDITFEQLDRHPFRSSSMN